MFAKHTNGFKTWPKDNYEELAKHYDDSIGSLDQRTELYKQFFAKILKQHNCRYVLDSACGTGVDSVILLEHGFKVVSVDLSAQMLEHARKHRELKRGHPLYDDWIIEQASWETLPEDLSAFLPEGRTQFDAVVCLANSISHILNEDGNHTMQRTCLRNLAQCVKPGGVLLIDHRNYDPVLNGLPVAPKENVYYKYRNSVDIKSELIMKDRKPERIASKFFVGNGKATSEFELCSYPHRLSSFSLLLDEAFEHRASHAVYGDFRPVGELDVPGFYQHVMVKPE